MLDLSYLLSFNRLIMDVASVGDVRMLHDPGMDMLNMSAIGAITKSSNNVLQITRNEGCSSMSIDKHHLYAGGSNRVHISPTHPSIVVRISKRDISTNIKRDNLTVQHSWSLHVNNIGPCICDVFYLKLGGAYHLCMVLQRLDKINTLSLSPQHALHLYMLTIVKHIKRVSKIDLLGGGHGLLCLDIKVGNTMRDSRGRCYLIDVDADYTTADGRYRSLVKAMCMCTLFAHHLLAKWPQHVKLIRDTMHLDVFAHACADDWDDCCHILTSKRCSRLVSAYFGVKLLHRQQALLFMRAVVSKKMWPLV